MRSMFRNRVDQKQFDREAHVAISRYYDIVSVTTGEMRVHCHSRKGLSIAEDCHFAAFSAARLALVADPDGYRDEPELSVAGEAGRDLADFVVRRGMQLVAVVAAEVGRKQDCLDGEWRPLLPEASAARGELGAPPGSLLPWLLGGGDLLEKLRALCCAAQEVLQQQAAVSEVTVPAKVFGDIHGQLRDLLLLFHFYGIPGANAAQSTTTSRSASTCTARCTHPKLYRLDLQPSWSGPSSGSDSTGVEVSYVFNGDWVDRGEHQLEVVALLFALKIIYPSQIWLNRGNHEDMGQNFKTTKRGSLGFDLACQEQLGMQRGLAAFQAFHRAFEWLPLAARIGGRILVLHGGLGTGQWTLEQLRAVDRPLRSKDLTVALGGAVYNVLWSDPLAADRKNPVRTYGVHPSHRTKHSSVMKGFGRDVTEQFCAREGLGLIIRSHQFKQSGKGYELQHDGWLMRVFSARNYCGESSNDGGLLVIGHAEGSQTLLVRPQNVERLPLANGKTAVSAMPTEPASEPYCRRGHLMQLVEPWPNPGPLSLSCICGDKEANVECDECGAEDLQVRRFYNCRACGQFDLCLACAVARAHPLGVAQGQDEIHARKSCPRELDDQLSVCMSEESEESADSDQESNLDTDSFAEDVFQKLVNSNSVVVGKAGGAPRAVQKSR